MFLHRSHPNYSLPAGDCTISGALIKMSKIRNWTFVPLPSLDYTLTPPPINHIEAHFNEPRGQDKNSKQMPPSQQQKTTSINANPPPFFSPFAEKLKPGLLWKQLTVTAAHCLSVGKRRNFHLFVEVENVNRQVKTEKKHKKGLKNITLPTYWFELIMYSGRTLGFTHEIPSCYV